MALFAASLALGHTLLCCTIKSGTIEHYLRNVARHIIGQRRLLQSPMQPLPWIDPRIDLSTNKTDSSISAIVKEVKRWENMPERREPLTVDMIAYQQLQCNKQCPHGETAAMYDWFVFGIYAGNRLAEWAQYDGTTIGTNLDGTTRAFIIDDLSFYGENRRRMSRTYALENDRLVKTIDVRWRFQKNGVNGEKKTFVRTNSNKSLCAVSALLRISHRWSDLNLESRRHGDVDFPLAVFTSDGTTSGDVKLISEIHINNALREAAKMVYNITDDDELSRFSSHSIRVGACVALHAANISELDIQHALRWRSNSFWNYLRNLPCQAQRTSRAVTNFNPNRLDVTPLSAAAAA